MMNNNFLSIIIPTYNRKDMLKRCLDSLFNQTYPKDKYEIIIVDDGSTDTTEELIKNMQSDYKNLRYLKQHNQGPATARNLGVKHAQGEILVFTDSDCVASDSFLESITACFKKYPDISACEGHEVLLFRNRLFAPLSDYYKLQRGSKKDTIFSYLTPVATLNSNRCAIKKDAFLAVGGFDSKFKWSAGEDRDLAYKFLKRNYKICVTDSIFIYHHQRNTIKEGIVRWYRFGDWNSIYVQRYFRHQFVVLLPFEKSVIFSHFPFTFYLYINLTKIIFLLLIFSFFCPKIGIALLGLYFLRRYIIIWKVVRKKWKSIKIFFLYYFYRFVEEIPFFAGCLVSSIKNRMIHI